MLLQLKFGLKALFRNPIRIVVSFLVIVLSLAAAGMSIFASSFSIFEFEKSVYFSAQTKYTLIGASNNILDQLSYEKSKTPENLLRIKNGLEEIGVNEYAVTLSETSIYTAAPQGSGSPILDRPSRFVCFRPWYFLGDTGNLYDLYGEIDGEEVLAPNIASDWIKDYQNRDMVDVWECYFNKITCYSDNACEAFGYEVYGRLPRGLNEIAIPQWLYNSFLCYGYRDPDTGEVTPIHGEEDLIGRSMWLGTDDRSVVIVKIVGVIHADLEAEEQSTLGGKYFFRLASPCYGIAVSEECYNACNNSERERFFNWVYVLRYGEHKEEIFDFVAETRKGKSISEVLEISEFSPGVAVATSPDEEIVVYAADERLVALFREASLQRTYGKYLIYFDIVPYLSIFAAGLAVYFCASTICGRNRGIKLLRQLGESKARTFLIFAVCLSVFMLICAAAALGLQQGIISLMNAELEQSILKSSYLVSLGITLGSVFQFTWQTALFDFAVPILCALVTSGVITFIVTRDVVISNQKKSKRGQEKHKKIKKGD